MAAIATLLKQARQDAGLSLDALASWSRLPVEVLRGAEDATVRLTASELDRCARVFGLRLEDLLAGEAGRAPMTVLLRSETGLAQDTRAVLTTEIDEALGELQRVVRDVADLERALGLVPPRLPRIDDSRRPSDMHRGEHRARRVREELGLGIEPIPSMRRLVDALGVAIVWVTEEQVDKLVDGACVMAPRPAMLVNLFEAANLHPWRARITIAHEIGHLLFDLTPGNPVAVSLAARRQPAHLEEIEQVARAFAACLLVPAEGVRKVVGALDPTSDDAVQAVGSHFGVGRTVAINRLQTVFSLTDDARMRMGLRTAKAYKGDFTADQPPEPVGFRGEPLLGLVGRALRAGVVPPARARRILGLSPFEPLPFPELGELSEPVLRPEHAVVRKASAYLAEQQLSLVPGAPTRVGDRWHVPLTESGFGPGEPRPAGVLVLDALGEVERIVETPGETGATGRGAS